MAGKKTRARLKSAPEWEVANLSTHVRVVERVRQLDDVAGPGGEVDLVLGDEFRAVVVVLLRDEGQGRGEDAGARVCNPGGHSERAIVHVCVCESLQNREVRVRGRLAGPGHVVVRVGDCRGRAEGRSARAAGQG